MNFLPGDEDIAPTTSRLRPLPLAGFAGIIVLLGLIVADGVHN